MSSCTPSSPDITVYEQDSCTLEWTKECSAKVCSKYGSEFIESVARNLYEDPYGRSCFARVDGLDSLEMSEDCHKCYFLGVNERFTSNCDISYRVDSTNPNNVIRLHREHNGKKWGRRYHNLLLIALLFIIIYIILRKGLFGGNRRVTHMARDNH